MNYPRIFLIAVILYFTPASYVASQEQQSNGIISAVSKSAEQGDRIAQHLLGMQYVRGDGVVQDYTEAAKWFRKSAEQGVPMAQFQLAMLFVQGNGVPLDYAEAVKWFRKAAEKDHPNAQFNLGLMNLRGDGIQQNYEEAAKWLRKAAEQGVPSAQCMLGAIYIEGWGVTQNFPEAYKWLTLSQRSTDSQILEKAKNWRDTIAKKMTALQIENAQKLVQEWKPVVLFNPPELSELASLKGSIQVAPNKIMKKRPIRVAPNRITPKRPIQVAPNNKIQNMEVDSTIVGTGQRDATLIGIVKDNDGKPLSRAQVAYINLDSDKGGGLLTPSSGEYNITYYPGSFAVEVTRRGFKPWSRSGIILESGETQHLDIVLVKKVTPDMTAALKPEEYAQQAVEAVKQKWESKYTDHFQYEVIGEPVIRPVHDADISGKESKGRSTFGLAPRALVLVKMRKGEQIYYTALVSFLDQVEKPQVIIHTQYPFGSTNRYYPMEEEEWSQVVKDLEPFYKAALDISRGPERFEPFIQYMLNNKKLPEGVSSDLLAPVACLPLHEMTLKNWLQFEGLAPDDSAVWSAWVDLERADLADSPKASRNLLKKLDKWKEMIRKAGSLDPDQFQSVSAYMRQMFGKGLIVKHPPVGSIQRSGLSQSDMVYSAFFCQLRCNVQFAYIEGRLCIVGISVPKKYGLFRGLY